MADWKMGGAPGSPSLPDATSSLVTANGSTAHRTLAARFGEVLNVKDFGAVGDGVADDYAAVAAAFAAATAQDGSWSDYPAASTSRSARGSVVVFPDGTYRIGTRLDIPGTKNLTIRAQAWHGARLVNATSATYLLRCKAGVRRTAIEGLVLDGNGVGGLLEFEAGARGWTRIWDCRLEDSADYAIKALGASVVYVDIYRNDFMHNAGGISNEFQDNDGWRIRYNNFAHHHTNSEVVVSSTGVVIEDNDFEVRKDAETVSYAKPWVHLTDSAGSGFPALVDVLRNRFGDEVETALGGYNPRGPREAICIGPIDSYPSAGSSAIRIEGNYFRSTNLSPSSTLMDSAIRLNLSPQGLLIRGNDFNPHYSAIVSEAYYENGTVQGDYARDNVWQDNVVAPQHGSPVFSHGGVGFEAASLGAPGRAYTNLLRDSEAIAASATWAKTNVSVLKDVVGPDAVAASAFTVTRTASGASLSCATASAVSGGAGAVLSFYAKLGGGAPVGSLRASVYEGTISKWVASRTAHYRLSSEWQRFEVPVQQVGAHVLTAFFLFPDDGGAGGTFLLAKPQLEEGSTRASAYMVSGSTAHSDRQFGSVSLGSAVVGYGTAAPVSGRYEAGDVVIHSAPAATSPLGWRCTEAGSPGTWTAMQSEAHADSTAADVSGLVSDFNGLLAKLRAVGLLAT